ncbi:MAG: hypothetical protein MUQ20_04260, partial [Deltaproteobacteria bacterium]|nr:hypothetical protein [Deltaproteobacteria bacterium]
ADKIVKVWEGDVFQYVNGHVAAMRACDHQTIQSIHILEYVPPDQQKVNYNIPPYMWGDSFSFDGPAYHVPADKVLPWMDEKLKRCTGLNPTNITSINK